MDTTELMIGVGIGIAAAYVLAARGASAPATPGVPVVPGPTEPAPTKPAPPIPVPVYPGEPPAPPEDDLPRTGPLPPTPIEDPVPGTAITALTLPAEVTIPISVFKVPKDFRKAAVLTGIGKVDYQVKESANYQAVDISLKLRSPSIHVRTYILGHSVPTDTDISPKGAWNLLSQAFPEIKPKESAAGSQPIGASLGRCDASLTADTFYWLNPGTYVVDSFLHVSQFIRYSEGRVILSDKLVKGPSFNVTFKEG